MSFSAVEALPWRKLSGMSWKRCWVSWSTVYTPYSNSRSKDSFWQSSALTSHCVVSRFTPLSGGFLFTMPDVQWTESQFFLFVRHGLGAGDRVISKESKIPALWSFPQVGGNETLSCEQLNEMILDYCFWGRYAVPPKYISKPFPSFKHQWHHFIPANTHVSTDLLIFILTSLQSILSSRAREILLKYKSNHRHSPAKLPPIVLPCPWKNSRPPHHSCKNTHRLFFFF